MEAVTAADELLQTTLNNHERDLAIQIAELDDMKSKLTLRMNELTQKKEHIAKEYGSTNISGDDLIEINAGGKVIAAKRSTLTQLEGTRLAGIFSGRWDKKLQRDSHGRIFLDVNPVCFQAIVDYLTEILISSEDSPPEQPSVDNEHEYILQQQLNLFLQQDRADSNIIEDKATEDQFHSWLKEDDSDGKLKLLYRGSKDMDLTQHLFMLIVMIKVPLSPSLKPLVAITQILHGRAVKTGKKLTKHSYSHSLVLITGVFLLHT